MWTIDDLDEFELPDDPCDIHIVDAPECPECGEETAVGELCADCAELADETLDEENEHVDELPF